MNSNPKTPVHYVRNYLISIVLGLIALVICIYLNFILYGVIILGVLIGLPLVRLISNLSGETRSSQVEIDFSYHSSKTDVNENINRYIEARRINKEKAKWWQFWI